MKTLTPQAFSGISLTIFFKTKKPDALHALGNVLRHRSERVKAPAHSIVGRVILVVLAAFAAHSSLAAPDSSKVQKKPCSRAQEYITALEYLRSKSEWALPEKDMRRVSREVALSCPGSAGRFIRVGTLLTEAGVTPREALASAIRYAAQDDDVSKRFVALFKKLYFEDQLDLDIRTATTMAHALAVELEGSLPGVEREFADLTDFCVSSSGMDQGKPRCARFAAQVIQSAKDQPRGVFKRWRRAYDFLLSSKGAGLTTGAAATLAAEVVATGEQGGESFIQAYRYAVSRKGLQLERQRALEFSRDLVVSELASSEASPGDARAAGENRKPTVKRLPDITVSAASRAPAQSRSAASGSTR